MMRVEEPGALLVKVKCSKCGQLGNGRWIEPSSWRAATTLAVIRSALILDTLRVIDTTLASVDLPVGRYCSPGCFVSALSEVVVAAWTNQAVGVPVEPLSAEGES